MVRVGTFNAENLFARYRFASGFQPTMDGFTVNDLAYDLVDESAKQITGKAIKAADADILALQEIESLPVLDTFNSRYLGWTRQKKYPNRLLVDGNDPRRIDVAIITREPYVVRSIRSYRDNRRLRPDGSRSGTKIFGRDCLEVDVEIPVDADPDHPRLLTLFVNHFKSMMGGREETADRREEQAEEVMRIVRARFGDDLDGDFIVLGDLNDSLAPYPSGRAHPLRALDDDLVNAVDRLSAADEGWTHYYDDDDTYQQLDYLYVSRRLWESSEALGGMGVHIERSGLPWRAERFEGERIDGVGDNRPKASDHCPVVVELPNAAVTQEAHGE